MADHQIEHTTAPAGPSKGCGGGIGGKRALGVPEILEHVLLQLPFLDLFRAQRVSSRWHEIIRDSPEIQQRMFLRSAGSPLLPLTGFPAYGDECYDFRHKDHVSPCQTTFSTPTLAFNPVSYVLPSHHEKGPNAWITNAWPGGRKPIVELEIEAKKLGVQQLSNEDYIRFEFKRFSDPLSLTAFRRSDADATWRKTLLTQPPITAVEFFLQDWREGGPERYRMANPDGVTLGDLQVWEGEFHKFGSGGLGLWAACGFWVKRPESVQVSEL